MDLVIVGIYMVVLVLVGIVFGKLVTNGSDYFRAGARGSWWMVGSSMFMAGVSAYTFVGNAAGIYASGWSPLAIYAANVSSFVFGVFYLGAWYRQMRVITLAEAVKQRFGKVAEQIVAHLIVFNNFLWAGMVLYTLAVFIAPLVPNFPVQGMIIVVGVVVVAYCTVGGNWAVMANDFVQGLVLIIVTVIITFLCFYEAGGVMQFFDEVKASAAATDLKLLSPTPDGETSWTMKYGMFWLVITFVHQFINQSSLFQGMRYFSAKDGREAAKASLLASFLMTVGLLVFFVPPIFARVFLEAEVLAMHEIPSKAAEYAYSVTSFELLPTGTFSIMVVAIFAAAISSLDTGLNRNAALIIRDLLPAYRKLFGILPLAAKKELFYSKLTTILSGLVLIGLALFYASLGSASIFDIMLTIVSQLLAPQVIPLMLFLVVRKVPRWAIITSLVGGYLPSLVVLILSKTTEMTFTYQEKGCYVLVGCISGYMIACLFWSRVSEQEKAETKAFYDNMNKPVDFASEVGEANDAFQLTVIGRFALLLGALFLLLLIPLDTASARIVILIISGFVGGIGLLMMIAGKRIAKKEKLGLIS